jgi:hypothetical protein
MDRQFPFILLPRVLRAKDAPFYLGMDRNRFNKEVKPYLVAIPIGTQGIGYDRFDLDAWLEDYKQRNGQPGAHCQKGDVQWEKECRGYTAGRTGQAVRGISTKSSEESEFARVVTLAMKKRRKGT